MWRATGKQRSKPFAAKAPAGATLPEGVALRLHIIQEKMVRGCRQAFAGTGVTPTMHAVLAIVRDNPAIRQGALADALMVKTPNVTAAITGLERAGFVSRTLDPGDSRVSVMTLTESGQRVLEDLQARLEAFEQGFLGHLDPREQQDLREILTRLNAPCVRVRRHTSFDAAPGGTRAWGGPSPGRSA